MLKMNIYRAGDCSFVDREVGRGEEGGEHENK
jgi:hypothetical protein